MIGSLSVQSLLRPLTHTHTRIDNDLHVQEHTVSTMLLKFTSIRPLTVPLSFMLSVLLLLKAPLASDTFWSAQHMAVRITEHVRVGRCWHNSCELITLASGDKLRSVLGEEQATDRRSSRCWKCIFIFYMQCFCVYVCAQFAGGCEIPVPVNRLHM